MNTLDYKKYRVLLVDDEVGNLGNLLFAFELTFDIVTAASGAEALEIMEREMFAVIISDQRMPTMTGTELLSRVKENYPQTVRILITAYTDIEAAVAAINSGDVYRYIGKEQPIDEIEAYIRQAIDYYHVKIENERLYEELNEGSLQTITALAKTLDARDPYTFGHSERVTDYAQGIAEIMGFSEEEKELLRTSGLLHDIGKIAISDDVLKKPGRLTFEEYEEIKRHSLAGAKIIEPIPKLQTISNIVLHHHERYDGKGYPSGIAYGDQAIEMNNHEVSADFARLAAWILPVSDTFDAMTSPRPYRDALPHKTALEELERCKGSQFVPEVVDAFLEFYHQNRDRFTPFEPAIDYKKYPVLFICEDREKLRMIKESFNDIFTIETASDCDGAKEALARNKDIRMTMIFHQMPKIINREMINEMLANRFPLTRIALNCQDNNQNWDELINRCKIVKYSFNPSSPQALKAEIRKGIEAAVVGGLSN